MPLTVANVQAYLVGKLRGKLAFVGMSVLADGTNPDLVQPLFNAASTLGLTIINPPVVADADLLTFPAKKLPAFYGLAQLFALEDIWGAFVEVNETALDLSQSWSSMSAEIRAEIARLEARYATLLKMYGPVAGGRLTVRSAARWGDCEL